MISTAVLMISLLSFDQGVGEDAKLADVTENVQFETSPFIEPGTWWNLYFVEGNNPLKRGAWTINSVRVVQIHPDEPNWVRVAYPRSSDEHKGIISIAGRSIDEKKSPEEMIMALEESVSDWKYEWFNLDYVVRMNMVAEEYERQLKGGKLDLRIDVKKTSEVSEARDDN